MKCVDYGDIEYFLGIGRAKLRRMIQAGEFPDPIPSGQKEVRLFPLKSVTDWIQSKEAVRVKNNGAPPVHLRKN